MTESTMHEDVGNPAVAALDDDAWLRELVTAHAAVLRRIAATQVGPDAAEDVVSEAFATAWQRRASFDPTIAPARAWLVGITLNRCRVVGRTEHRWARRLERLAPGRAQADFTEDAIARLDAVGGRGAILTALQTLPEEQRLVLLLVARGGLSSSDIAAALSMPAATVRSHLLRARRTLAHALDLEEPHRA